MLRYRILFWLVLVLAVGCEAKRGEAYQARWPNSQLKEQGRRLHDPDHIGAKIGTWREWFEDGRLKSLGEYRDGRRSGEWTYWHANGRVYQKGLYDQDLRLGRWREWYEGGVLANDGEYREGRKHGRWRFWAHDGRLLHEADYREGISTVPAPITKTN